MSDIRDVRAYALLKTFESPDESTIVEAAVKLGGYGVASEDLCRKFWRLYFCHVWTKANVVEDVLNYLWFQDLDSPIL